MESDASLVYESPDGGNTIYARRPGEIHRTLVYESPAAISKRRWHKWKDILEVSDSYPSLKHSVEQAELIYELVKEKK
jgi:hypothetical protein